ncbi:MAG: helix-turn-helix transcriptional regulator [Lachnospiraceae bacterium]|nr:helix-turn-helix transcriptional regulator [Lachnospiraceae bacterium]
MKRKYPAIDVAATGKNIKRIMKDKGYTVKDIQMFLGLATPQGIYHWFEGKSMPTLDNLYALSELFQLPIDTIIRGNRKYIFVPFTDGRSRRLYIYYRKFHMIENKY